VVTLDSDDFSSKIALQNEVLPISTKEWFHPAFQKFCCVRLKVETGCSIWVSQNHVGSFLEIQNLWPSSTNQEFLNDGWLEAFPRFTM
jgi:hypothetical protein